MGDEEQQPRDEKKWESNNEMAFDSITVSERCQYM